MKERPIIFTTEMVKAILEGRKTQTRRAIEPQPKYDERYIGGWCLEGRRSITPIEIFNKGLMQGCCPYGQVGDRLWVRETWQTTELQDCVLYKADYTKDDLQAEQCDFGKWRPSIHMFRQDSRITLEITDIRVERLQEIKATDALKEGVGLNKPYIHADLKVLADFTELWDSLNAQRGYSWDLNPWVWVISFKEIKCPS